MLKYTIINSLRISSSSLTKNTSIHFIVIINNNNINYKILQQFKSHHRQISSIFKKLKHNIHKTILDLSKCITPSHFLVKNFEIHFICSTAFTRYPIPKSGICIQAADLSVNADSDCCILSIFFSAPSALCKTSNHKLVAKMRICI